MCYSATVSFASAAVLAGGGLVCLKKMGSLLPSNGVLPLLPLLFGIQQALEGVVWLSLGANESELLRLSALGFLLFSHVLWPVAIPLSCYLAEPAQGRKGLFLSMTLLGAVFAVSTYGPLWLYPDWLGVEVVHHSIVYRTTLFYDALVPRELVTFAYAAIILLPLLLSVRHAYRMLGVLMLLAGMLTAAMFKLAFISVWCFFAALLSLYIYYVVVIQPEPAFGASH